MQRLSEVKLCSLLHRQLLSEIGNTLTLTCRMNSTKWMPSVAAKRTSSVRVSEPSCRYLWKKKKSYTDFTQKKKLWFVVIPDNVDPPQHKKPIPVQGCPSKTADSGSECPQRACRVSHKKKTPKINRTSAGKMISLRPCHLCSGCLWAVYQTRMSLLQ